MIYHILNGDGLAGGFDLNGEIITCREAFIEGSLQADSQEDFWNVRSEFIKEGYDRDLYFEKVKSEFDKLDNLQPADEVNLWFGGEAFCQVNLWFCLQLLVDKNAKLFRVFPGSDDWDCSFNDLKECVESRQTLTEEDLQLGKKLWQAFSSQDFEALKELGKADSECFPRLREVCQALVEKTSKPKEILQEIVQDGEKDFGKIFLQFRERAGIYGFGDSHVKNLLETS